MAWSDLDAENRQAAADAKLARDRVLSAARQARFKARKRAAGLPAVEPGTKVTRAGQGNGKGNGGSNGTLTRREGLVADAILHGASDAQAVVQAGFPHQSTQVAVLAREALQAEIRHATITRSRLYRNIVRRDEATKPVLVTPSQEHPSGCIERPDWSAQAASARDQADLLDRAGELPSASGSQQGVGNQIAVNIILYQDSRILDVVGQETVVDTITSPIQQT